MSKVLCKRKKTPRLIECSHHIISVCTDNIEQEHHHAAGLKGSFIGEMNELRTCTNELNVMGVIPSAPFTSHCIEKEVLV